MQILFSHGLEHGDHAGVGIWQAPVERLTAKVLPHMGWNTVSAHPQSQLFKGVESEAFYFVHSYGVTKSLGKIESFTDYQGSFIAAIEDGSITATQFHPEKSGDAGLHLIKNWVATL
jgi:glutamine amidotransferase